MASIKFDNTEILDTTHIPRFVKHESTPERFVNTIDLPRENGSILINTKYGMKRITLSGILTGSSEANLDAAIDTFKELFSREQKNLDVSWNGATRRYVATCEKHDFDRDYFNLLFVPWSATFLVSAGTGEETTETLLINAESFTTTWTDVWTFAGTAAPKPRLTIAPGTTSATCLGVELKNIDNGQRIVVPVSGGLASGTNIEIDCRLKTCKVGGVLVNYYGQFPEFKIGDNNIQVNIGEIVDQAFDGTATGNGQLYGTAIYAQSFTVSDSDATHHRIYAKLMRVGSPSGNMAFSIVEDDNGEPGATVIINGTFAAGSIGVSSTMEMIHNGSQYTLESGKRYWLVLDANTVGDASNKIWWAKATGTSAVYKRGNGAYYSGAWIQEPSTDYMFSIRYQGTLLGASCNGSVNYYKQYL